MYSEWVPCEEKLADALKERDERIKELGVATAEKWLAIAERDRLRAALDGIIEQWEANASRIFETMGDDNPRVAAVDAAIDAAIRAKAGLP